MGHLSQAHNWLVIHKRPLPPLKKKERWLIVKTSHVFTVDTNNIHVLKGQATIGDKSVETLGNKINF